MILHVAVLCDAATDHAGKLNILGAFDTIAGTRFPLVHPHCAIALRMRFGPMEEGRHKLALSLIDGDGRDMVKPVELNMTVRIPADGYFVSHNAVINFERLAFKSPGQYAFGIALDGRPQTTIPLQIVQVTPKKRPPANPGENAS